MKLRKSHYSLKFSGVMQLKKFILLNGHNQLMFEFSDPGRPRVWSLSERLVLSML